MPFLCSDTIELSFLQGWKSRFLNSSPTAPTQVCWSNTWIETIDDVVPFSTTNDKNILRPLTPRIPTCLECKRSTAGVKTAGDSPAVPVRDVASTQKGQRPARGSTYRKVCRSGNVKYGVRLTLLRLVQEGLPFYL